MDEDGYPLPVHHGTTRDFKEFSHEAHKNFDWQPNTKNLIYFTSDKNFADEEYAKIKQRNLGNLIRHLCTDQNKPDMTEGAANLIALTEGLISGEIVEKPLFEGSSVVFFPYKNRRVNQDEMITFFDGELPNLDNTKKLSYNVKGQTFDFYFPKTYQPKVKTAFLNVRNAAEIDKKTSYDFAFEYGQDDLVEDPDKDGIIVAHEQITNYGAKAFDGPGFSFAVPETEQILCLSAPENMLLALKKKNSGNAMASMANNFSSDIVTSDTALRLNSISKPKSVNKA